MWWFSQIEFLVHAPSSVGPSAPNAPLVVVYALDADGRSVPAAHA